MGILCITGRLHTNTTHIAIGSMANNVVSTCDVEETNVVVPRRNERPLEVVIPESARAREPLKHDRSGGMPAVNEAGGVAAGNGGVAAGDGGVAAGDGGVAAGDGGLAAEETSPKAIDPVRIR